jgi:hypothetical protein
MDINAIWFLLLGLLLTGYAVLDGFDLGVGILHLLARDDRDRRLFLNSIGPIWDGNEVWLIVFGGALFAAFPMAYATVFSGFYLAFMALCGFRCNWSTDSGVKWPTVPVDVVQTSGGKWSSLRYDRNGGPHGTERWTRSPESDSEEGWRR